MLALQLSWPCMAHVPKPFSMVVCHVHIVTTSYIKYIIPVLRGDLLFSGAFSSLVALHTPEENSDTS